MVHSQYVFSNMGRIQDIYNIDTKILGEGGEASVYQGTHKKTVRLQAVKSVRKTNDIKKPENIQEEIAILKKTDHPNIIKLYETFEDRDNIYLVMEFCAGGDLATRIIEADHLTEHESAVVMRQVLSAVSYMHKNGICHRDLKPENVVCQAIGPIHKNVVKVIDFGLACSFRPGCFLSSRIGTPEYVAPEVLSNKYNHKCDLWSCGVLLYVLLSGFLPFYGRTNLELFAKISRGNFVCKGGIWDQISFAAIHLIHKLLVQDPHKRHTAEMALNHMWLKGAAPCMTNTVVKTDFINNLCGFYSKSKFKKAALNIIARHLNDEILNDHRNAFEALDVDGDGVLTVNELENGLKNVTAIPLDFTQIVHGMDADGNGVVEYTEFLGATLPKETYLQKDYCLTAFNAFDRDGDGKISQDDLGKVLSNCGMEEDFVPDAKDILQQFDQNGDNMIDFEEFVTMMQSMPLASYGCNPKNNFNQIHSSVWYQSKRFLKNFSDSLGKMLMKLCSCHSTERNRVGCNANMLTFTPFRNGVSPVHCACALG